MFRLAHMNPPRGRKHGFDFSTAGDFVDWMTGDSGGKITPGPSRFYEVAQLSEASRNPGYCPDMLRIIKENYSHLANYARVYTGKGETDHDRHRFGRCDGRDAF